MQADLNRYNIPPIPKIETHIKAIYPWENTNLSTLCRQLYIFASDTGYTGTYDQFRRHFGAYLEAHQDDITIIDKYTGTYTVTPLPSVDQILRTKNTRLVEDIVIERIPYYETSNEAGGYTVVIG